MHKNSRIKKDIKDRSILSDNGDSVLNFRCMSKSVSFKSHKSQNISNITAKIFNDSDICSSINYQDDTTSKSFLKMPVNMSSYLDKKENENLPLDNIAPSHYKAMCCKYETTMKSNIDKLSCSKICSSCRHSSAKIIKCKTSDVQFQVSIKTKKSQYCNKNSTKVDRNCDAACCKQHSVNHRKQGVPSVTLEDDTKILKLDLLLQFLDQMRHMVVTRELSFDIFRSISQRLIKGKMNIELLMLIDVIIRAQVIQMTRLISKDLSQNKITPPVFVTSLLKQYQFLKSLSQIYKHILSDYESNFMAANNLSFDLISRAYFKLHMYNCPKIKEHIVLGHLDVTLEHLCNNGALSGAREKIKTNYATLKSDFQETNRWKEVEKTMQNVFQSADDVVRSLMNFLHNYYTQRYSKSYKSTNSSSSNNNNDLVTQFSLPATYRSSGSYKELLQRLPTLPDRELCSLPQNGPHSLDYFMMSHTGHDLHVESSSSTSSLSLKLAANCRTISAALENIKPPSISCSSSSNNSKGYNSCVSISSYEDSSDDDDGGGGGASSAGGVVGAVIGGGVGGKDEKFFQTWKRGCDVTELHTKEHSKPSSPLSFNDDVVSESRTYDDFMAHKGWVFRESECGSNQDEISKFNKLYEQYLAENEHLMDCERQPMTSRMSVPDYLSTLKKADNLQSIIKILMEKYRKNMDLQDSMSRHTRSSSPTTCSKHREIIRSMTQENKIEDDEFEFDFEELSKTFGEGSTTREDLEEFEKFLESRLVDSKGKTHPNIHELMRTYRLYCSQLPFNAGGTFTADGRKEAESESSEMAKTLFTCDLKMPVSGDESFDVPLDCVSSVHVEADSGHGTCPNSGSMAGNHMSSSETSSSSNSTENTSNNKVCNCCKCEMFGEQSFSATSRPTNVVEKLRIKLQKRKECQLKSQSGRVAPFAEDSKVPMSDVESLPDVDTLVNFINGADRTGDTTPQTPDVIRSFPKKNKPSKPKSRRTTTTKSVATSAETALGKRVVIGVMPDICLISELRPDRYSNNAPPQSGIPDGLVELFAKEKGQFHSLDEAPDKDLYDPVVEDFKRFCSNVVVPKHRKKLPVDASLLIDHVIGATRSQSP